MIADSLPDTFGNYLLAQEVGIDMMQSKLIENKHFATLRVPHKDLQQLFKRMVFNIIFRNVDNHLKNPSFIYNKDNDSWNLTPAYDLTYAPNPLLTFKTTSRALSING